jgi:hypothetical protein
VAEVLSNVEASLKEQPREIYFVYAYPVHKHLFEQSRVFEERFSNEWYTVYKAA